MRARDRQHKGQHRRPGLQRAARLCQRGHQNAGAQARRGQRGGQQFGRVGQLRHGARADKGADLDVMQASGIEAGDGRALGGGGDKGADGLKAVARADFDDAQAHGATPAG